MKRAYVDVETTGVHAGTCGIVQIAMIIEIDGEIKEALDLTCRPFVSDLVMPSALEIHKETEKALRSRQSPQFAHQQLLNIMGRYVDRFNPEDKFEFIAYNANFDDAFVREWFSKCGDRFFGSWFWWPPLDVAMFAMTYLRGKRARMPNFKLHTVAKELGIKVDDEKLHDALYDIQLTYEIAQIVLGGTYG